MTEISLQIWHNNSSEGFLSNPLATCLPKFAGGVQKQQLPLSFPCIPVACWILHVSPTRGESSTPGAVGLAQVHWARGHLHDNASGLEGLPGRPSQQRAARQPCSSGSALHHYRSESRPLRQQRCPGTPALLLPALARGICFLPTAYTHSSPQTGNPGAGRLPGMSARGHQLQQGHNVKAAGCACR